MDTDLALVLGLFVAGFSVPSMMSAFSDQRTPRTAMIMILIAGALIIFALATKPGGYSIEQFPDVFFEVISRFMP